MKRKFAIVLFTLATAMIAVCGCGKKNTDTDNQTTKASGDVTIFDKVIAGVNVDDEKSLYDVTDTISVENYTLIDVAPYKTQQLLCLYNGEEDSKIIQYDLKDGDKKKEITIGHTYSESATIGVTSGEVAYVYDDSNRIYAVVEPKSEKIQEHTLDFKPESMLINDSGNRIFYTLSGDCKVYQYIIETENSSEMYDGADEADNIILKSLKNDDSTFIVYATMDNESGYARLSIEMQELEFIQEQSDELYYTGQDYICISEDDGKYVGIYNELKPRLYSRFELEEEEELDNFRIYEGGPYIFTAQELTDSTVLRFYDVSAGIMYNSVKLDDSYAIRDESFMEDFKGMCLKTLNDDGQIHVLIWDYEDVSDLVS